CRAEPRRDAQQRGQLRVGSRVPVRRRGQDGQSGRLQPGLGAMQLTPSAAAPDAPVGADGSPRAERAELSYDEAMALAMSLHREGRLEAGAKVVDTLRRVDPRDPNPVHFLGVLQQSRGYTEQGLALIRESIAMDPKVPDWHNNLGNVLLEAGRVDEAASAYE